VGAFFLEMMRVGIYKRSQGRVVRQVTFAALAVTIALGLWRLNVSMVGKGPTLQFAIPGVLLLIGLWASYRVVNVPSFADFLIAVEAEMNKVSWPTRSEAARASSVVLILMFLLAGVLFVCDYFWHALLMILRIL
jgi:preprotein translocase subunit SecE